MRPLDLEAIEARCEMATKGPWWAETGIIHAPAWWSDAEPGSACHPANCFNGNGLDWYSDAEFVAHARTDIPALLAAIKRLYHELRDERVRRDEWEQMYNQAIAGTEVERLQAELAAVKAVAKTWFKKAMKCKKELDRVRLEAQDQSDEVQELWLSPAEAEGLKRQLKQMEAQFVAVGEAVSWLWGFWDGNSLRAMPGFEDDIRDAWDKLLESVESPAAAKLLERLERLTRECDEWCRVAQQERAWVRREQRKLGTAEAALAGCGLTGIYDRFSGLADAIEQMVKRLVQLEGRQALQNERQLRQEAEQELKQRQRQIDLLSSAELRAHQAGRRTENLQQEKVGVHEALDECQIPRNYDDGKLASARTRIFWLNRRAERAEALAALVTPELAELLERLADYACSAFEYDFASSCRGYPDDAYIEDEEAARALAARIREALGETDG